MRRRDVSERIHPFLYNRKFRWSRQRILWAEFYFHYQKGKRMLKLKKAAVAGTLESSDVMISIEPGHQGRTDIEIISEVKEIFGKAIEQTIWNVLQEFQVESAYVVVRDKGALDFAIRARMECAVCRAAEITYDWSKYDGKR